MPPPSASARRWIGLPCPAPHARMRRGYARRNDQRLTRAETNAGIAHPCAMLVPRARRQKTDPGVWPSSPPATRAGHEMSRRTRSHPARSRSRDRCSHRRHRWRPLVLPVAARLCLRPSKSEAHYTHQAAEPLKRPQASRDARRSPLAARRRDVSHRAGRPARRAGRLIRTPLTGTGGDARGRFGTPGDVCTSANLR